MLPVIMFLQVCIYNTQDMDIWVEVEITKTSEQIISEPVRKFPLVFYAGHFLYHHLYYTRNVKMDN